jgi:hypothetical protein
MDISILGGLTESAEYQRHDSETMRREQGELDDRFTADGAIINSQSSRDAEFRRLVRDDLIDEGRLSDRLSGILFRDHVVREAATRGVLQRLSDWTRDERNLVSGDTLLLEIVTRGGYAAPTLKELDRRAHVLHWACHVTPTTRVPHVQRVTESDHLDPLDPEVFWAAMRSLLGEALIDRWHGAREVDAVQIALELRATGTWSEFREVDVKLVAAIDALEEPVEAKTVIRTLQQALPSRSRVLFRRIVSLPAIAIIAGALRAKFGDLAGGGLQLLGGSASLANDMLKQLDKYNVALREDVALHVRSALRRVSPDGTALPIKIRPEDIVGRMK